MDSNIISGSDAPVAVHHKNRGRRSLSRFLIVLREHIALVLIWLCGMWAFGLGLRLTLELMLCDGWISIPKYAGYGVNIWFDFLPLCIFGFVVTVYATYSLMLVCSHSSGSKLVVCPRCGAENYPTDVNRGGKCHVCMSSLMPRAVLDENACLRQTMADLIVRCG